MLNNLDRQNTGDVGRSFFFCCVPERQNFQAAALFPRLTSEILPLSGIISQEIMLLAAKFPSCRISCDTGVNSDLGSENASFGVCANW